MPENENDGVVTTPPPTPDVLGEVKDLRKTVETTMESLRQLVQSVKAPPPPRREPEPQIDVGSLLVDDTDKFVDVISKRAADSATAALNQERQKDTIIANLVNDFPELRDESNAFRNRAVEIYNALPPEQQTSARAYEQAVTRAALEHGVQPLKFRPKGNDGFTLGSKGGPARPAKGDKEFEDTLAIAAALGRPVNDPKYRDSLKKYTKRTDYSRYRSPGNEE